MAVYLIGCIQSLFNQNKLVTLQTITRSIRLKCDRYKRLLKLLYSLVCRIDISRNPYREHMASNLKQGTTV